MNVVMGPALCQGCGQLVYFFGGNTWSEKDGRRHVCGPQTHRRWLPLPRLLMRWRGTV